MGLHAGKWPVARSLRAIDITTSIEVISA